MKVNIEDLVKAKNFLRKINSEELSEIEWFSGGKEIPVSLKTIEDFRFYGLSNTDFPSILGWME